MVGLFCVPSHNQFTGKERDAETGLDYFLARYYSGAQGRFTSTDPIIVSRGDG
jgi:RHS repeat-associated protein